MKQVIGPWFGLLLAALILPLLVQGCGLLAGQAISTALGSTRDIEIQPSTISLMPTAQQQFTATGTKVIGNSGTAHPQWTVDGNVGFIDQNGLFTATNQGQGDVRGTISTGAGLAKVTAQAKVYVVADPNAPVVGTVTLTPASGPLGTTIQIHAQVSDPQGLSDVRRVSIQEQTTGLTTDLVDDGAHGGDQVAHDGTYSAQLTVPPTIQLHALHLGVYAIDFEGHASNWVWQDFTVQ